jgi:hypothetical protein
MNSVQESFIEQKVVFMGGFAYNLFAKSVKRKSLNLNISNYDVLHENPEKCAVILIEKLKDCGVNNIKQAVIQPFGEIVPKHINVLVNNKVVATIYTPIGCHNYNTILINGKDVNIATIDTMLSFYLAFVFINNYKKQRDSIFCMATQLFEIQKLNRFDKSGLLTRFNIQCIGKQPTLQTIRHEKNELFKQLTKENNSKQIDVYFLNYKPTGKLPPHKSHRSKTKSHRSKNTVKKYKK